MIIVLRDLTSENRPVLQPSTPIRIDIHDTCARSGDLGPYGDLLKGCFVVNQLKDFIKFSSYSYDPDPVTESHLDQYILSLHGTIGDHPDVTLSHLQALTPLVREDDEDATLELWDEVHGLGSSFHHGVWNADDCPLPALFRATRVEQLLCVIQDPDGDSEERDDSVRELLELEPKFADNKDFMHMHGGEH